MESSDTVRSPSPATFLGPSPPTMPDVSDAQIATAANAFFFAPMTPLDFEGTDMINSTGSMLDISASFYPELHTLPPGLGLAQGNGTTVAFPAPESASPMKRKRSSVACKACHNRRVRCDAATKGLPCSNCRSRAQECALIDSRRRRGRSGRFEEVARNNRNHEQVEIPPQNRTGRSDHAENNDAAQRASTVSEVTSPRVRWTTPDAVRYQRNPPQVLRTTKGGWVVHIGEPSLLSWLVNGKNDSKNMHRIIDETSARGCGGGPPLVSAGADEIAPMTAELEMELLDSFRQNFLPLYPIVPKKDLEDWGASTDTPPPLLRASILFIGALHTSGATLNRAGFPRKEAVIDTYYRKARHIYDSDDEIDRVCLIQSTFMLQFRFGSRTGYRDCFWWAGTAVNLAQTIGMHRSTKNTEMKPADRRLWKKIWWLLFIRDRQLASGMGKPMVIDERDCDVEELTMTDFVDGETPQTANFVISMMQLAKIATQIIRYKFSPAAVCSNDTNNNTRVQVHLALQAWHARLDPSMQYDHNSNRTRYGMLLSLIYHWMLLLLHRPSVDDVKHSPDQRDFSTQLAFHAADMISNLAGDIVKYFNANGFPIYAEMIILSSMMFHSAEDPSCRLDQKHAISKKYRNYAMSLQKLDQVFSAIPTYKLYFGANSHLWENLMGIPDVTATEAGLLESEG